MRHDVLDILGGQSINDFKNKNSSPPKPKTVPREGLSELINERTLKINQNLSTRES